MYEGEVVPDHSVKVYRGSRGIAPLICNLGTRWRRVVNFVPLSFHPWERTVLSVE